MDTPTSLTGKQQGRFELLDGIRGLAILWIICFHVIANYADIYGPVLGFIISHGSCGVVLFLIVSGFGISKSAHHLIVSDGRTWSFLKRRLLRIFVPYIFGTVFALFVVPQTIHIVLVLKGLPPEDPFPEYSLAGWISLLTLTRVFAADSWGLGKVFLPFYYAVWYLAIIIQIYIVIGIALIFRRHYDRIIMAVTALSVTALFPKTLAFIPYGLFLPYWPSFAVGILIFHLWKNDGNLPFSRAMVNGLFLLSALLLIIPAVLIGSRFFLNFVFSLACGALIWALYPQDIKICRNMLFRPLLFLGTCSYSLFLLHGPFNRAIKTFLQMQFDGISDKALFPIIIPIIIALGYGWYLLFERPFQNQKKDGCQSTRP